MITALLILAAAASQPAAKVAVKFSWEARNFPAKMQVFEPSSSGKRLPLWETKSIADPRKLPIANEVEGGKAEIARGSSRRFVLIAKNEGKEPIYFFATPHSAHPPESALGFKFHCLCINHAFKVMPGETWYRVVDFKMDTDFIGSELEIMHNLIGITAEQHSKFELKQN